MGATALTGPRAIVVEPAVEADWLLLERFRERDDRAALGELLERHADIAYRVARRLTGNDSDAEDVLQEAFLRCFASKAPFRGDCTVRSWIIAIVANTHRRQARARNRRRRWEREAPRRPEHRNDDVEVDVQEALEHLPERYRVTLAMRFYDGLASADIASAIGLREASVRQQVNRGLKLLRVALGKRGLAMSVAGVAGALGSTASASAPPHLAALVHGVMAKAAAMPHVAAMSMAAATGGGLALPATTIALVGACLSLAVWSTVIRPGGRNSPIGAIAAEQPAPKPAPPRRDPATAAAEKYFGPQRDWPRFRGPMGTGVTAEKGLPTTWSKTENILWSADTFQLPRDIRPFYPYASPIVCKDRVFIVLCSYKPSIFVDPPRDLKIKAPPPATFADLAEFRLVSFRKSDGKRLWDTPLEPGDGWPARPMPGEHGDECSIDVPTPCTDGERVYVTFGAGANSHAAMLEAVDYQGKVVWRQDMTKDVKTASPYGGFCYNVCTSPVLYKDAVIMDMTVGFGQELIFAFDGKTGEPRYHSFPKSPGLGGPSSGANTPAAAVIGGRPFLLYIAHQGLQGIDPETGTVVFQGPSQNRAGMISVAVGSGMVFCDQSNGLVPWMGEAFALDALANATGDISGLVTWKMPLDGRKKAGAVNSMSPVICNGYIYRAVDNTLHCCDVATGKLMYTKDLSITQGASPFATADGYVYFATSRWTYVIKAGPTYEEVAVNKLEDNVYPPGIWDAHRGGYPFSSAAVSEGRIFILGNSKLWCIGK